MRKNSLCITWKRLAFAASALTTALTGASPVLAQTIAAATTAATTTAKSGSDQIAGVDKPLALLIIGGLVVLTLINVVTIARKRRK